MKKFIKIMSVILAVIMVFAIPAAAVDNTVTASSGYRKSGSLDMPKLSKTEIVELLNSAPLDVPDNVFEIEPSCDAPYSPGKVKSSVLQATTNRVNVMRRLAGVPDVVLDMDLCENAQYGAILASVEFDHYPSQPADMDNEFFNKGYEATSSSNLSIGYNSLIESVDGWMDDGSSARLGHRRWQINPTLQNIGFGWTVDTEGAQIGVEKILDQSGTQCNYDFISWPASGNFPNNTSSFSGYSNTLWSVTLNPSRFQTPNKNDIKVILTRENDKTTWTFDGKSEYLDVSNVDESFFDVNTSNCGVPNCIIFRPKAFANFSEGNLGYEGTYTVKIDGIKTLDGHPVTDFTYQVNFFNTENYAEDDPTPTPSPTPDPDPTPTPDPDPDPTKNPFTDVKENDYYYDPVLWAFDQGITKGTSETTFAPEHECLALR